MGDGVEEVEEKNLRLRDIIFCNLFYFDFEGESVYFMLKSKL